MKKIINSVATTSKAFANDFKNFIENKLVFQLALATFLATYLKDFIGQLMNEIGVPIIDKIINSTPQHPKTVKIFGVIFRLDKLISLMLNFMLTIFIVFLIFWYLPKKINAYVKLSLKNE